MRCPPRIAGRGVSVCSPNHATRVWPRRLGPVCVYAGQLKGTSVCGLTPCSPGREPSCPGPSSSSGFPSVGPSWTPGFSVSVGCCVLGGHGGAGPLGPLFGGALHVSELMGGGYSLRQAGRRRCQAPTGRGHEAGWAGQGHLRVGGMGGGACRRLCHGLAAPPAPVDKGGWSGQGWIPTPLRQSMLVLSDPPPVPQSILAAGRRGSWAKAGPLSQSILGVMGVRPKQDPPAPLSPVHAGNCRSLTSSSSGRGGRPGPGPGLGERSGSRSRRPGLLRIQARQTG